MVEIDTVIGATSRIQEWPICSGRQRGRI